VNESPESLLQSLRNPLTLPFEAIKAAKSDRARVAPLLIQELQKYAADFQGYDRNDCLPVIAIYLLAEWEVTESFETVLDCFALDRHSSEHFVLGTMERAFGATRFQHHARVFKINSDARPDSLERVESRPERPLPLRKRKEIQEMLRRGWEELVSVPVPVAVV
jgi:hypothetical protein